jgi:RecA-family ATPase
MLAHHQPEPCHDKGEERPDEIPGDLPLIAQKIKDHDARLFIIDPLFVFLYGADANKDQEIRRVLYKLSKIVEKYHCAVVCMRHLNKAAAKRRSTAATAPSA